MKSTCVLQAALFLSSLLSPDAQDVTGPGPSCPAAGTAGGHTRVTFLREDAAGARALYLTVWSEDMRLVTCEVNSDPVTAGRYRALCDRDDAWSQEVARRLNVSRLLAPGAPCAPASPSASQFTMRARGDGTGVKARRKRAWILPGTLWCGSGSRAVGYEQLGMFESADRCCREHDHCQDIIPAFRVNYGVFNPNVYTVSHCDCDQRFRQCLRSVNDSISNMVGYSFFHIFRIPCFELKQQKRCTEMYWWGMCKVAKEAPYAVFKNPLPYNTSNVTSNYEDTDSSKLISTARHHVTRSPIITSHRESAKAQQRCGFRDQTRGDTFHRRRTKGRGCRRQQKLDGVAPSQMPPLSRAHATTPSMKTIPLNATKSMNTSRSNRKRAGQNKSNRKSLVPPQGITNSHPRTSPTTPLSTSSLTQGPRLQLHPATAVAAVTTTIKRPQKVPKTSRCCGSRAPVRGDTFQPRCKNCLEQKPAAHMETVTPAKTATSALSAKTPETARPRKTAQKPKRGTSVTRWNGATFTTPMATKLKTSLHKDGTPQKQLWNNTSQEVMGSTIARSTHAERHLKQNNALHNMTGECMQLLTESLLRGPFNRERPLLTTPDSQLLCGSLKHLDECKFKIPPLEGKYGLQNTESKTAYHCDCMSRLAVRIESFKQPSVLPSLLLDFVSLQCFTLPKDRKCRRTKSCSRGFTKASDLHQALKKIEEQDTAGVRISGSGRERGIPVRLYKRCLRLERGADIMAQLR